MPRCAGWPGAEMPYLNVVEVESALQVVAATHPGFTELVTLPPSDETLTVKLEPLSLNAVDGVTYVAARAPMMYWPPFCH